ncbi:helix-turn-helix domain-containing protein [Streptomyces sp. CA-135486]|uniref:RICIN domain-containing protein n=1 Tax=Streptomyces sp. CA-135486 TaxID=3240049 RepID=UPI003D8AF839
MASAGQSAPDPELAQNSAEFVARMQALKEWSGLTYRELTARADAAGDVLPRSTVANMLSRSTVPREELVAAFVRACGCGPEATETWLRVRKELTRRERQSLEVPEYGVGDIEPDPGADEPPPAQPRRPWLVRAVLPSAVVALGVVALAVTLATRDFDDSKEEREKQRPSAAKTEKQPTFLPPGPPQPGRLQIRAVHSGLCLAEDGGQNGQLYQQPCAPGTTPRFSLKRVEPGWRIVTFHKQYGEGCTGVMEKSTEIGAPVEDQECGKRGPAEAFRLEPVGTPVRGYRLRPLHTDLCAGVEKAVTRPGAEIRQLVCTDDAKGQLFAFERQAGTP